MSFPNANIESEELRLRNTILAGLLWALLALLVAPATAQFDSGSSGADGPLTFTCTPGGETVEWDAAGLDIEGDRVFHFTTVDIPSDCTILLTSRTLGQQPIIWLAQGDVAIDGIVDLSGEQGHGSVAGSDRLPALPGPGGFAGGLGTVNGIGLATNGLGPGGGTAASSAGGAGHAGFGVQFFVNTRGVPYGTAFLRPLLGGSGGGGSSVGGGGGAGGGAILIASSTQILVDGQIVADGGEAGIGGSPGSGSGGAIRLAAPLVGGAGQLTLLGGTFGQNGSGGRLRIETLDYQFSGAALVGDGRVVTLADTTILTGLNDPVFPTLRVVSVDGVPVPANPTGGFTPADVTINETNPVDIQIEAQNVPLGTTVDVLVHNETTGTQAIVSAPLAGSETLSTALATGLIDPGFSSVTLRADF